MMFQTADEEMARAVMQNADEEGKEGAERWFQLSDWFAAQPERHDASFVSVLEPEDDTATVPSILAWWSP